MIFSLILRYDADYYAIAEGHLADTPRLAAIATPPQYGRRDYFHYAATPIEGHCR